MRPLEALGAEQARALRGVVLDLDGTLLTDGRLTSDAYQALGALGASGLRLVVCTGRPAGWGEVLLPQWPVDLWVAENGAVGLYEGPDGPRAIDRLDPDARRARRERLAAIAQEIEGRFPQVQRAGDCALRRTDVAFDVGERRRLPAAEIELVRAAAAELGARTFTSSVHLDVTLDLDDKATGTLHALWEAWHEDPTAARTRYAYVGDSANDAACFAAFRTSFGVATVREHTGALSVPPAFVSPSAAGRGFAEIADRLVALRWRAERGPS
ncbi:MAG: HAD-IIB family hydrolase [Deltaproteobacteria bacterium]|nr:HAD-IIB family hydrolase [Deltaproteobacteria bacterium]